MKAKIDVTIFKNGDMDILQASIYEELWKDYCTFKQRAFHAARKGNEERHLFIPPVLSGGTVVVIYLF